MVYGFIEYICVLNMQIVMFYISENLHYKKAWKYIILFQQRLKQNGNFIFRLLKYIIHVIVHLQSFDLHLFFF